MQLCIYWVFSSEFLFISCLEVFPRGLVGSNPLHLVLFASFLFIVTTFILLYVDFNYSPSCISYTHTYLFIENIVHYFTFIRH